MAELEGKNYPEPVSIGNSLFLVSEVFYGLHGGRSRVRGTPEGPQGENHEGMAYARNLS